MERVIMGKKDETTNTKKVRKEGKKKEKREGT